MKTKALLAIITLLIATNAYAEDDDYRRDNFTARNKAEYFNCVRQVQFEANGFSRCLGRHIQRDGLPDIPHNMLIEAWSFFTVFDFPKHDSDQKTLIVACRQLLSYVHSNRDACRAGL